MPILKLRMRAAELTKSATIAAQHVQLAHPCAFSSHVFSNCAFPELPDIDSADVATSPIWPSQHTHHVAAELEGRALSLQLTHRADCSFFETDAAAFWVDAQGNNAELLRCDANPEVWLFGPMLVLALARRGIYCLHASAYQQGSSARVIVARSGAGKSTAARVIQQNANAQTGQNVRRLCDDITPVQWRDGGLQILPQFPQLKLSTADQALPQALPLSSLVQLTRAQAGDASSVAPLDATALYFALLQHTVATRLFSAADTRAWWQQLPKIAAALAHNSFAMTVEHDANAPERAMLAALQALPPSSLES
jgi:hypothetical protein